MVWNVEKVLKQDAPHFDVSQVGVTATRMPNLRSAKAIDKMTVELTTAAPDALLPINLTNLFMASPAHWKKLYDATSATDPKEKAKQAWDAFARNASGTGPWKMDRFVPRERLELVKNAAYWDAKRVPKVDRLVLLPMPEANARTAALLSGQVDWIENPAPDALPQVKQRGFVVYQNEQPHVWPWQFSRIEGSPWNDLRVRKAANLCVDRNAMKDGLLGGLMVLGDRHVRAGSSVARQPEVPDQVRSGRSQEADDGSRLLGDQEAEGEDADLGLGLRPDAAAADERVRAAEPRASASSTSSST